MKKTKHTGIIRIAGHHVDPGHPCFIIAEAGDNHNGFLALATKLVDAAVRTQTDAVRFQTFNADRIATTVAPKAAYQKKPRQPGRASCRC